MNAVGRAAQAMVDEVRRQFREIKGILEGKAEPDYASCVAISTKRCTARNVVPLLTGNHSSLLLSVLFSDLPA